VSGEVQPKPYSVSSLTAQLKSALESKFARIYVEAEISGWKLYPSGHAYFTLKDSGAQIQAVMFANALARCRAKAGLKDGAKVVVYANVSVYAPRGNYQLVVLAAKIAGEGDLMQRYLELKERLGKEGLFEPGRKRPLPFLPRRIGIVTSEAGAVIHDMCTVLTRRFPAVEIRLFPCQVQGSEAPATIVRGIGYFNESSDWTADVIIVARGGGSFEDLFCFNDETLVRAVAASRIPTVSAVGHETDFTLCDFAADVRAGTPSIAAERVVPVLSEILARLDAFEGRLLTSLRSKGEWFAQRVDHLGDSLAGALAIYRERLENRFARAETRLALLSPYSVLERGYSLTVTESGNVVRDSASLAPGERIVTRFCKGEVVSEVVA
jgi:exodeoxyribonuclease VII large subunit